MSDLTIDSFSPLNRLFKMAILAGVGKSVRLHIDRGDKVNARDSKGMTPLIRSGFNSPPLGASETDSIRRAL